MSGDDDPRPATDGGLEQRSRELLLASSDALDAQTRSRLTAARHTAVAALAGGGGARPFRTPGWWLPGGALAAAALLAVAVWLAQPTAPRLPLADAGPAEDSEILASGDGPELYADEAEFYEWAGGDGLAGGAGSSDEGASGGARPGGAG
jgi:hypothetical protein